MKTALATLAAAGLALSATAAQAETVHVTYDDLDLGSIAGQKVLSARATGSPLPRKVFPCRVWKASSSVNR